MDGVGDFYFDVCDYLKTFFLVRISDAEIAVTRYPIDVSSENVMDVPENTLIWKGLRSDCSFDFSESRNFIYISSPSSIVRFDVTDPLTWHNLLRRPTHRPDERTPVTHSRVKEDEEASAPSQSDTHPIVSNPPTHHIEESQKSQDSADDPLLKIEVEVTETLSSYDHSVTTVTPSEGELIYVRVSLQLSETHPSKTPFVGWMTYDESLRRMILCDTPRPSSVFKVQYTQMEV